ncbi:MAG: cytochrome c-type biogenesis protein CcmH [Spirochaetia bacterium]|nr:cytochrome c-type biogenesis protein CcmH [Spirochaetia bacterium]
MKKKIKPFLLLGGLSLIAVTYAIYSQSAHSNLSDPVMLKKFKYISERLMCPCGCALPLNTCNMSDCIAWDMRKSVEILLKSGQSEEFIINGFINGFGPLIDTDPAFRHMSSGVKNLFRRGMGEEGFTEPYNRNPEIWIAVSAVLFSAIAGWFIRSHFRKINLAKTGKEKEQEKTTEKEEELYKKLYDE